MTRRWLFLSAAILGMAGCGPKSSPVEDMNALEVTLPSGKKFLCQTMIRDIDLVRGMMFQDSLAQDRGMLVMYPREDRHPLFMYNVKIPLDFVWLDQQLRVVEMVANAPPCVEKSAKQCPNYGGQTRSRYILEINAGLATANGLKVGDLVGF